MAELLLVEVQFVRELKLEDVRLEIQVAVLPELLGRKVVVTGQNAIRELHPERLLFRRVVAVAQAHRGFRLAELQVPHERGPDLVPPPQLPEKIGDAEADHDLATVRFPVAAVTEVLPLNGKRHRCQEQQDEEW